MSKHKFEAVTDFTLEGRFLGFAAKESYKLKYLRLATVTGEYTIKIDKELRSTLWRSLTPGEWIRVSGYQKGDRCEPKLKAYQVTTTTPGTPLSPTSLMSARLDQPVATTELAETPATKAKILVCQKSDCCRRGGTAITEALQKELRDRQLTDQVTIKGTGCMKRCKAGPNIIMPDKTRYSGISPDAIPTLIDRHLKQEEGRKKDEG
ncbi:(2Fe-2S) ferredoxin domain-containing protein [Oscillatoria sp. FACHB-1407]|uniref:(2Fe-2S) ferredoxin domain-containing protein n=1 Tax=Oscillatoria sp. FACHB-1407 TaxID=2692847 RepID=UPI00168913F4|nr:(2Fe-2S) ferredoxin domain-containing protein [Oscillatoria sp. FACHB-1407]MBD2459925.1 (2Fe-2S) ferredoxin domain-containing protein [Oscillatoria sp. FACHB-1407]